MTDELVTIVIPTHNDDPEHLRQAVNSAVHQSYPAVEVIVVDDGSTHPKSIKCLESLAGVQLVRQDNRGPGEARNTGIRRARGEFILPLDGDDWIEPDAVQLLVAAMGATPVVGAFPSVHRFGAAEGLQGAPPVVRLGDIAVTNKVVASALYRRRLWAEAGGYRSEDIVDEDWFMWLKLLGHTRGAMVQVPDAILHYRLRAGSRSGSRSTEPGVVQRAIVADQPDLAGELYVAAALEAQSLGSEVAELRAFHRAWSPRVAPLLRVRDMVRRRRGRRAGP